MTHLFTKAAKGSICEALWNGAIFGYQVLADTLLLVDIFLLCCIRTGPSLGPLLLTRWHLEMYGDIFDCDTSEVPSIYLDKRRNLASIWYRPGLFVTAYNAGGSLPDKNYLDLRWGWKTLHSKEILLETTHLSFFPWKRSLGVVCFFPF